MASVYGSLTITLNTASSASLSGGLSTKRAPNISIYVIDPLRVERSIYIRERIEHGFINSYGDRDL